jgi:hypothetical protein
MAQKAGRKTVTAEVNRDRALDLRRAGWMYHEIGAEIGVSKTRAYEYVREALEDLAKHAHEKASEIRATMLLRLDRETQLLMAALEDATDDKKPRIVDSLLRIDQRRAELLGLDAPKSLQVAGPTGGPIQVDVTDIRDRIAGRIAGLAARMGATADPGGPQPAGSRGARA